MQSACWDTRREEGEVAAMIFKLRCGLSLSTEHVSKQVLGPRPALQNHPRGSQTLRVSEVLLMDSSTRRYLDI